MVDRSSLSPAAATCPLPICSKHTLPNVLSRSQTQAPLFPCGLPACSVLLAVLPCHLSSPRPHARWLPAAGSTGAPMALQCGSPGTRPGATRRDGEALRRKQWMPLGTGRASPVAEQGLLHHPRGPRHRQDVQVPACWPSPYKAAAGSADTCEMPGGTDRKTQVAGAALSQHKQSPALCNAPSSLPQSHFSRPGDKLP